MLMITLIYGFVWMVALYRSLALRPVLVGRETVLLQVGFLWRAEFRRDQIRGRAEFRRDQIRGVRRYSAADTGYLSLVVINEPQWLIELHEPVVVCGPFGR